MSKLDDEIDKIIADNIAKEEEYYLKTKYYVQVFNGKYWSHCREFTDKKEAIDFAISRKKYPYFSTIRIVETKREIIFLNGTGTEERKMSNIEIKLKDVDLHNIVKLDCMCTDCINNIDRHCELKHVVIDKEGECDVYKFYKEKTETNE